MRFEWIYHGNVPQKLKSFLQNQGISKRLLAKIKFQGGEIAVNQTVQNVLYLLTNGDIVTVKIPDEVAHERLIAEEMSLDIIYEDEHFLVINKPAGVASIPSQYHPQGTMANFIKAYYQKQNYPNQVIHVVTRLDRDTSGLMLFAKHGFAHALLDYQLRSGKVVKKYQAWVASSERLEDSGEIIAPIGRDERSIIARMVRSDGKPAHTSYQTLRSYPRCRLVDIRLHTGRTHQIRVHFSFLGAPLLGDTLYGGTDTLINRQALHCYFLEFWHPFLSKTITLEINLPRDMQTIKAQL